jgi:hypothetical protein
MPGFSAGAQKDILCAEWTPALVSGKPESTSACQDSDRRCVLPSGIIPLTRPLAGIRLSVSRFPDTSQSEPR